MAAMAALCAAGGTCVGLASSFRGNGRRDEPLPWAVRHSSAAKKAELAKRATRGRRCRVSAVLDDFDYSLSGPIEPFKPKFTRENYDGSRSVVETPGSDETQQRRRRKGRKYKKASPPEAVLGAAIAGACASYLWVGLNGVVDYLTDNPPAHDLPNHLTGTVNSCILAMVWGMGGIAVTMFGVAAVGLSMLAVQTATKQPPTQPPKTPS